MEVWSRGGSVWFCVRHVDDCERGLFTVFVFKCSFFLGTHVLMKDDLPHYFYIKHYMEKIKIYTSVGR